jgi:broad specificity phosphatase PhoE
MTCIILVGHNQTEWNRVEGFRGQADIPLNETGLAQTNAPAGAAHT